MRKVLSFSAPQVLLISEMSRVSSIAPSGAEVLLKSVEVGEAKSIPLESIPQQYDIGRTVAWLKRGNFQRIALQFPDDLLADSVGVAACLEAELGVKPFILADTAYGSCCVDEVAAGHGNADCLVHYGPACLSASEGRIPVYYVFHKLVIDVGSFELILAGAAESLRNSFLPQRHNILMLIDFAYQHAEDLLVEQTEKILSSSGFSVRKSSPCFPSQSQSQLLNTSVLFGYESECFSDENFLTDGIFLLIGSEGPLLTNFIMAFPSCPFVTYDPHSTVLRRETIEVNRLLRKRLFLVEKLKDANVVGILVGTLGAKNYLQVLRRLQQQLKNAKKKFYSFCVGHVNVAKLANFPEVEVFILISCPFNNLIFDSTQFYRPIVTPFEAEVAFGVKQSWFADSAWTSSFSTSQKSTCANEDLKTSAVGPDFSLVSGKLRPTDQGDTTNEFDEAQLVLRAEALQIQTSPAADFFRGRSWRGLEERLGETPVESVKEGRKGIASGYQNELNSQ